MIYILFFLLFMLVPILMTDIARQIVIEVMEAFDF